MMQVVPQGTEEQRGRKIRLICGSNQKASETVAKKSATLARSASVKPPSAPTPAVVSDQPHNGHLVLEDAIRLRAFEKWEAAGKPNGDGACFWLEAENELTALLSPTLPKVSAPK